MSLENLPGDGDTEETVEGDGIKPSEVAKLQAQVQALTQANQELTARQQEMERAYLERQDKKDEVGPPPSGKVVDKEQEPDYDEMSVPDIAKHFQKRLEAKTARLEQNYEERQAALEHKFGIELVRRDFAAVKERFPEFQERLDNDKEYQKVFWDLVNKNPNDTPKEAMERADFEFYKRDKQKARSESERAAEQRKLIQQRGSLSPSLTAKKRPSLLEATDAAVRFVRGNEGPQE
jgi:hypothetical protein